MALFFLRLPWKIYPYRSGYLVAAFEEVINNYSSIIQKTNNKFNTNFIKPKSTDYAAKDTFLKIESIAKIESIRQGAKEYSELKVSRPSPTRNFLKKQLIEKLEQSRYHELLKVAKKIYSEFLS